MDHIQTSESLALVSQMLAHELSCQTCSTSALQSFLDAPLPPPVPVPAMREWAQTITNSLDELSKSLSTWSSHLSWLAPNSMSIFFFTHCYICYDISYTFSGNVEYTSFPSYLGVAPKPQVLETLHQGTVYAMEWSSDGYVLTIGWGKGWAVWSVSVQCLAWSFEWGNWTDKSRYD